VQRATNRIARGVELFAGTRIQTRDRPPYRLVSARSLLEDSITTGVATGVRGAIFYRVIRIRRNRRIGAEAKRPIRGCVLSVDSKTLDRARTRSGGKKEEAGEEKGYSMAGALLDRARFKVDGMDRCKSRARACIDAYMCVRARADNGARVDPARSGIFNPGNLS